MNAEQKQGYTKLIAYVLIAVVGIVLVSIALGKPVEVQEISAAGGLEVKIVERNCQFLQWEGTTIVGCSDGFEFTLPFVEAPPADQ